jgi:O-antigen/teichoic acid export membrane protein
MIIANKMSLAKKIAYNTFIQIIGKISSTLLGIFTLAIMARYLGQAGFGQYSTAIAWSSFFAIMADLGLTLVSSQMIATKQFKLKQTLGNLLSIRLVSAIFFIGLGPLIAIFMPYPEIVKNAVALSALTLFFGSLNQIIIGLFQNNLKMGKAVIAENIGRIILLIGTIWTVKNNLGLQTIMIVGAISALLNFALHLILSKKIKFFIPLWDKNIIIEIIKKSWPLGLTIFFNLLYLKSDTLMLSLLKSESEVGLYGASYKILDVLTTIPFMFCGLMLPLMVKAFEEKNFNQLKNVIQKTFDFLSIMAWPFLAGGIILSKEIMIMMAGQEFIESGAILKILLIASVAIFLGTGPSHAIIALGKQRKMIAAYIFVALSSFIGYLIFIPKFSYIGAAWVSVYSEISIALMAIIMTMYWAKIRLKADKTIKAILSAIIMYAVLWAIQDLGLVIKIISGAIVYFSALYLLKGWNQNDLGLDPKPEPPVSKNQL